MKFGDVEHNSVFDHSIYIYIYLIVLKEVTDMGCVAVSISLLGRKRLRGRGCSHARSKDTVLHYTLSQLRPGLTAANAVKMSGFAECAMEDNTQHLHQHQLLCSVVSHFFLWNINIFSTVS